MDLGAFAAFAAAQQSGCRQRGRSWRGRDRAGGTAVMSARLLAFPDRGRARAHIGARTISAPRTFPRSRLANRRGSL